MLNKCESGAGCQKITKKCRVVRGLTQLSEAKRDPF